MNDNLKRFSERFYVLRKSKGLSLEEVSNQLEARFDYTVNKGMLSKYERGLHEPNFTVVSYIAEIFDVNIEYMMGRSNSKYGEEATCKKIPIVGCIAAGQPILAQQNISDYIYVDSKSKADFALVVKGDSMINARICDGDLVFIRQQKEVETGEIAVVVVNGEEATLKRFYKVDSSIMLKAENPQYKDLVFNKKEAKKITIVGKAIQVSFKVV
jgi:repressor LexA